jgi:hypothetical protein
MNSASALARAIFASSTMKPSNAFRRSAFYFS